MLNTASSTIGWNLPRYFHQQPQVQTEQPSHLSQFVQPSLLSPGRQRQELRLQLVQQQVRLQQAGRQHPILPWELRQSQLLWPSVETQQQPQLSLYPPSQPPQDLCRRTNQA